MQVSHREREPPERGTTPLFLAAFALTFTIVGLIGWMLLDSRRDAWNEADMSTRNLAAVFEREIIRKISTYDLSLQAVIQGLRLPGIRMSRVR